MRRGARGMHPGESLTVGGLLAGMKYLMLYRRLQILLFLAFPLLAPAAEPSQSPLPDLLQPRVDFRAGKRLYAEFKDSPVEVSVGYQGLSVSYMGVSFRYRISTYNWKDAENIGFFPGNGDPWNELHALSISFRSVRLLGDETMLIYGLSGDIGAERQMSRSFGAGANLAVLRRFGESWSGSAGIMAAYHPLRFGVIPAIGLRYDDEDESGISASLGVPTNLKYRVDEQWRVVAEGGMASGTYRLKDNSPVSEKGYFRHRAIVPRLGVEYRPLPNLELSASGLYYFDRQWRVYDRRGSRIASSRLDSGPGFLLSAEWRF